MLVLPAVPYGVTRYGSALPGDVGISEETLVDRPDLVHRERMESLDAKIVDMPGAIAEGRTDFQALGMDQAYCGSPAEATAEEGEQTFETLAEMLFQLIREVAGR